MSLFKVVISRLGSFPSKNLKTTRASSLPPPDLTWCGLLLPTSKKEDTFVSGSNQPWLLEWPKRITKNFHGGNVTLFERYFQNSIRFQKLNTISIFSPSGISRRRFQDLIVVKDFGCRQTHNVQIGQPHFFNVLSSVQKRKENLKL